MTMLIIIASGVIAFIITNIYYHHHLKPVNDEKTRNIAYQISYILKEGSVENVSSYLQSITPLGYKIYLVDSELNGKTYGDPFKSLQLDERHIEKVLSGEEYHGIKNLPWRPFITGFFNNNLKNSIGIPVEVDGEQFALFVRSDTEIMFGEMRIFLAILAVVMLILTFLFVLISTRFIVAPIRKLREATKKIAAGNYHIRLDSIRRKDEIGRLAKDFTKMSTSLGQLEEKRQEFVSNVSHEIQSPLTSIQGFSQALQDEDLSEEERSYYLSIIEKESRRVSGLSEQLLTLSFLDRQEVLDEIVSFNIAEQLKDIISTTEWQWRNKNITIELNLSPIQVKGDPKLLYQVWMNIVSNAIRYTPSEGKLNIDTTEGKDHVDVSFSDTGIGISEEHQAKLFERFFIADQARTRTHASTGLGLSIAKKIIELHNGTIMVDSTLGEGSTFTVTLPQNSP